MQVVHHEKAEGEMQLLLVQTISFIQLNIDYYKLFKMSF